MWEIDSERVKKPTIRRSIMQFLASDFARPKRSSEIWEFVEENRICTKVTLYNYLNGLIEKGEVQKVVDKKKHVEYALVNWKFWRELQEKYEGVMVDDVKRMQEETDNWIKKIERGEFPKRAIKGIVLYALLSFEKRQLDGFDLLVKGEQIVPFVAPALVEDFIVIPYNLKIQLIWSCYENYPKETLDAIRLLKKRKMDILNMEGYRNMSDLLIRKSPLG